MSVLYTRDKSGKFIPIPSIKGAPGKSAYDYALEAGFVGTEEEFAELLLSDSIKQYGAVGDGVTDDTAAFQEALAAERTVSVPGGTYLISDTLVIRENCCLELSQDTFLKFTQTESDCIQMRGSAALRGNHAVIAVPYAFAAHVIDMDTLDDGTDHHTSIPPYARTSPAFKRQRFAYDVNIIKPIDYYGQPGFCASASGDCNGTAVYMSATNLPTSDANPNNADITFLWGITMSGIRIAGAFNYGIHAINYDSGAASPEGYEDDGWNHDMRIEAIIEGCEIGVALENCNGAYLDVVVQPTVAMDGTLYAKHGFCLNDSRFVDMTRSRVWDWNAKRTLWTSGGQYQHIALMGKCSGLLLGDFVVHETSADIRSLIYTDTEANFDTMTILQEPGNKNFKARDGKPYFYDGTSEKQLMLKTEKFSAEQAEFIHPADGYYTYEESFTNRVTGYTDGTVLGSDGTPVTNADSPAYTTTDLIPIDNSTMHTYRIGGEGIVWQDAYLYGRIAWFDADKNIIGSVMSWDKVGTSEYYPAWVEDETAESAFITLVTQAAPSKASYFRITARGKGENLIVTIDEPLDHTAIWHGEPRRLDESIHAKNDWNAKEGEVGYVANRTHYAEPVNTVIFPEAAVSWNADTDYAGVMEVSKVLTIGTQYEVIYDGVKYVRAAIDYEGMPLIGNLSLMGSDYKDQNTGEPFVIAYMDGMCVLLTEGSMSDTPADGSAVVQITEITENVRKLDRKYLPAMSYVITDVTTGTDSDSGTTANFVNESYDNFSDILWNGGTVWIRHTPEGWTYPILLQVISAVWFGVNTGWQLYVNQAGSSQQYLAKTGTWTPPEN